MSIGEKTRMTEKVVALKKVTAGESLTNSLISYFHSQTKCMKKVHGKAKVGVTLLTGGWASGKDVQREDA